MIGHSATRVLFAVLLIAVSLASLPEPALAGENHQLCNAAPGASIPNNFFVDACYDGSHIILENKSTLPLRANTTPYVSPPSRSWIHGPQFPSQIVYDWYPNDPYILPPGTKLVIPTGTAGNAISIEATDAAVYDIADAATAAPIIGDASNELDLIRALVDEYHHWESCYQHANFLGKVGCDARAYAEISASLAKFAVLTLYHSIGEVLSIFHTVDSAFHRNGDLTKFTDSNKTITVTPTVRGTPTLGRPWAPDESGYGEVRPTFISNGGDPTGVVTNVAWQSWGGPTATATGQSDYVGPGHIVATGTEESVTVVAFNLGDCDGQFMYQALELYFPQHGEAFDPNDYMNICTGAYVGSPGAKPEPEGAWSNPNLTITPTSLGAVRVGMSQSQTEAAAGRPFAGGGEGFYSPVLPLGSAYDYVGGFPVSCVGAAIPVRVALSQTVSTLEGFHLGDSVQRLLSIYGASARYVSAPAYGLTTNDGYVVSQGGGTLAFVIDHTKNVIRQITGGVSNVDPNSCPG